MGPSIIGSQLHSSPIIASPLPNHSAARPTPQVENKFRLDLKTDEEAERYMLNMIDESVNSLWSDWADGIHNIAVKYFK